MPKLTIAIPAYKAAYLADAIASVLTQDYVDYELLISDDRGDGSIREVVSQFSDSRIKLLDGPRRGLVANSAFLWDAASSEYIKFLYDDDLLYPSALGHLIQLIEKRADFVYAFCNRLVIDGRGQVRERMTAFPGDRWMWFDADYIPKYMMERIVNKVGEPSNLLIRRSAFESSRCLTEFAGFPIRHLIDVAFYMNAGLVGPCVATPQYLSAFRIHEGQVSARTQDPAFSAGVFEWEIFLRGSVQIGLVEPGVALKGVAPLDAHYAKHAERFEELQLLRRGLPSLAQSLAAGATSVVTEQFRDDVATAHRLIAERSAR